MQDEATERQANVNRVFIMSGALIMFYLYNPHQKITIISLILKKESQQLGIDLTSYKVGEMSCLFCLTPSLVLFPFSSLSYTYSLVRNSTICLLSLPPLTKSSFFTPLSHQPHSLKKKKKKSRNLIYFIYGSIPSTHEFLVMSHVQ